MKIVIDIDNDSYEHIKAYKNDDVLPMGWYAISHGTPLTKVDCISRAAVLSELNEAYDLMDAEHRIKELQPVQLELPPVQVELGNKNCVSRAELKKWLDMNFSFGGALRKLELFDRLDKELPAVTPQPKTGHWIKHEPGGIGYIECSECLCWFLESGLLRNSYCPNCGAKNRK